MDTVETINTDSWEEFEKQLQALQEERNSIIAGNQVPSAFLFRGQGSSEWELKTTLERRSAKRWTFPDYFRLVSRAKPTIETFTERHWDMDDYPALDAWSREYDNVRFEPFPGYDYLVYLRHHGFPSPFLDWTLSPYVAAYFAFARPSTQRVAIYVFMEYVKGGKLLSSDAAQIISFGPYIRSHPRHFLQQSQYTICARYDRQVWSYTPHREVFDVKNKTQDRLWKITMPASARGEVMRHLDNFNLNEFSLFQTSEALLESIATREMDINSGFF